MELWTQLLEDHKIQNFNFLVIWKPKSTIPDLNELNFKKYSQIRYSLIQTTIE